MLFSSKEKCYQKLTGKWMDLECIILIEYYTMFHEPLPSIFTFKTSTFSND